MTAAPSVLVLYARSDALGDGLFRIPAIRAARSAFPDARIVYATARQTTLATALRRHVADVLDEFRPNRTLGTLIAEFAPSRGSLAIADLRCVAGWLVGARARLVGTGIRYEANFPGYALSAARAGFGVRPEHNAWRYHRVVERLAGRALPFDHRLTVLEAAREQARLLRNAPYRPLVLLGANSAPHKALTAHQLVPVAERMLERGYDVVYLNSPGEGPSGAELAARVPGLGVAGPDLEVNGVPLLEVFLALGEMADAYVGPEGGIGHCMSGVGTPIVLVNYGAKMDRWRPLSGVVEVIEARQASPSGRSADTPPAAIIQALDGLLRARHRDHPRDAEWRAAGTATA